jgi:SAM-dependent methyltransferase
MALACPIGLDVRKLREEVEFMYARVAEHPEGEEFHFHRGADYAVEWLGYDRAALAALPAETTASFAGLANPFVAAFPAPGAVVVDVGSGAGTDAMLAARGVGPRGRVIGVDPTEAMLARARGSAARRPELNVEFRKGPAEALPVDDGIADVVISNGVFNLLPDKEPGLREVWRVLKPGGRFQLADVVVASELSEAIRGDIDLWSG